MASVDRLPDVPSADPEYLLPGARSLVSLMIPLDGELISAFLAKEDHDSLEDHDSEVYQRLYAISQKIAALLESRGYRAATPEPNLDYRRNDTLAYRLFRYDLRQKLIDWIGSDGSPAGMAVRRAAAALFMRVFARDDFELTPSFAHRYGAVAADLGVIGWSGNVLTPEYGARAYFITVLTNAELASDPMLDESPCDRCHLCARSCQSGFINVEEEDSITIGGREFVHNKKASNLRCVMVCSGISGQSNHKAWSTWSPGRFPLPDDDAGLRDACMQFLSEKMVGRSWYSHVFGNLVHHSHWGYIRRPIKRQVTTCGNCQLVCSPTREERLENYETLFRSGVVVEGPEFGLVVEREAGSE